MQRRWPRVVAVMAAGVLAGCGSSAFGTRSSAAQAGRAANMSHATAPPLPGQDLRSIPAPPPTGIAPGTAAVEVIRGWSDALRRGDLRGAARYFALPSVMINGPDASGQIVVITIRTRAEAEVANSALPCGARFISADQRGRYVNALFSLTDRAGVGGGCGAGTGQTARTNFVITDGRIVEWIRAPDDPGDNDNPPQGAPAPPPSGGTASPAV